MELTISRGAVIHVRSGHGVDPYFNLPMPRLMKGWQKNCFYLRNNAFAPLPVFTGRRRNPTASTTIDQDVVVPRANLP
jgi:hypothetical protein